MSATNAGPQRPPGRYGEARGTRRTAGLALLGALVVAMLSYLIWVAWHHATPDVRAGLLSYDNSDPAAVEVVLEVVRPSDLPVTCEVRAQNIDDVTVGTARQSVPTGGERRQVVTIVVPTTEQAVNGELVRCAASAPE